MAHRSVYVLRMRKHAEGEKDRPRYFSTARKADAERFRIHRANSLRATSEVILLKDGSQSYTAQDFTNTNWTVTITVHPLE